MNDFHSAVIAHLTPSTAPHLLNKPVAAAGARMQPGMEKVFVLEILD